MGLKSTEVEEIEYTKKPQKCKVAMFDREFVIGGDAMFTAVKTNGKAIITITLVKNI